MARSLSNVKLFSAVVADGISCVIKRRGFSASASQGVAKTGNNLMTAKKVAEEKAAQKVSWVPDPKTGYYRPETGAREMDPAELRAILLKRKN